MLDLIMNFKKRIEDKNLIEAICLSNNEGIIFKEQYIIRNNRNIYSHAKSFTSIMVGIAIDENKLTLDTRLVDVFKNELDNDTYNRLYDITVNNLLNMSSGFNRALLMSNERKAGIGYPDYFKFVISHELENTSGSEFCYSNGDTYLLSKIISKVYNKNFIQLCYEKIFKPLEIGLPIWGCDPMGECIAASDLYLNIEEMNRLGILILNKGIYKNKRIVSEEYINMCLTPQIKTTAWGRYSNQFWEIKDGIRADGAYGQITFIWPKYNYALSIQRPEDDKIDIVLDILKEEIINKL